MFLCLKMQLAKVFQFHRFKKNKTDKFSCVHFNARIKDFNRKGFLCFDLISFVDVVISYEF